MTKTSGPQNKRIGENEMMQRLSHVFWLLVLAPFIVGGCAIQYYDRATQTEHLWGLGHMKMRVALPDEGVKAIVKSTEVVGVSVAVGSDESHILLGWNRFTRLNVTSESTSIRLLWPSSDLFSVRVGSRPPFLPVSENTKKTQ